MTPRASNTDPPRSELRSGNAAGAIPEEIRRELVENPHLLAEVTQSILSAHFPETLHQDILDAVGLHLDRPLAIRKARDPRFRNKVLVAYEYRCAVCALDLRIGNVTVGLDAAHIQWHQAGGPDLEVNGIALCTLHHKIFDLGGFTIHMDHRLIVSEHVHWAGQFEEMLMRYHGKQVNPPPRLEQLPGAQYLAWHRREVFKGRARSLG
jgi:putative restriction endonuclease